MDLRIEVAALNRRDRWTNSKKPRIAGLFVVTRPVGRDRRMHAMQYGYEMRLIFAPSPDSFSSMFS